MLFNSIAFLFFFSIDNADTWFVAFQILADSNNYLSWLLIKVTNTFFRARSFSSPKGPKKAGSSQIGHWLEPKGEMARAILGIT